MRVSIGGFMGTGKTTVGRLVATRLGVSFVDLDAVLVERFGPIPDQFEAVGEAGFRDRERQALQGILTAHSGVLSTGGGTWADPQNRADLRAAGPTVVLTAPLLEIRARIDRQQGHVRPLWDERVEARFEARAEAYRDAERIIDTSGREPSAVAEEIVAWLS